MMGLKGIPRNAVQTLQLKTLFQQLGTVIYSSITLNNPTAVLVCTCAEELRHIKCHFL